MQEELDENITIQDSSGTPNFNDKHREQLDVRRTDESQLYISMQESETDIIQTYTDDVALIFQNPEGIKSMLCSSQFFKKWANMEVNVKKCTTASYLFDNQRHRCSLTEPFTFHNQDIPHINLDQSLRYLGTAVAARKNVKLHVTNAKFDEMTSLVKKIIDSPLLTVQKIDAINTFVIQYFDFLLLNGEMSKTRLNNIDTFIRGQINTLLKVPGLPVECHHIS
jgi:hypothetical protein